MPDELKKSTTDGIQDVLFHMTWEKLGNKWSRVCEENARIPVVEKLCPSIAVGTWPSLLTPREKRNRFRLNWSPIITKRLGTCPSTRQTGTMTPPCLGTTMGKLIYRLHLPRLNVACSPHREQSNLKSIILKTLLSHALVLWCDSHVHSIHEGRRCGGLLARLN